MTSDKMYSMILNSHPSKKLMTEVEWMIWQYVPLAYAKDK